MTPNLLSNKSLSPDTATTIAETATTIEETAGCSATDASVITSTTCPPAPAQDPKREVQEVSQNLSHDKEEGEVDKLQLLESIGEGSQGTVYRGRWRNLDVAIKASV